MSAVARCGALLLLLAAALAPGGCGGRVRRSAAVHVDSSFAAVAFQRNQSPETLARARGGVLYDRYCAICHGATGGGDGFNAYNIKTAYGVTPTAFGDSAVFAAMHEDTALAVIRDGGPAAGRSPAMPPWGRTLTPVEIMDVWQYVRSLWRTPAKD